MRKRTKHKKRSCGLCKPHKRGLAIRWKPRDLAYLKVFEEERAAILEGIAQADRGEFVLDEVISTADQRHFGRYPRTYQDILAK